jgi:hypothetical protein
LGRQGCPFFLHLYICICNSPFSIVLKFIQRSPQQRSGILSAIWFSKWKQNWRVSNGENILFK